MISLPRWCLKYNTFVCFRFEEGEKKNVKIQSIMMASAKHAVSVE